MRSRHPLSLAPRGTLLARRREQVSRGESATGPWRRDRWRPRVAALLSWPCMRRAATLFSLGGMAMRDRKANRTTFLPRLLGTPSASQTGTGYIYNAWCSLGSLCPRKRRWQGFGPHEPRKRGMIVARAFRTLPTVEISLISGRSGVGHQRGSEHGQTGRPSRGTRPARPPQRTKSRKPPNVAVLEFPLALVCRVWPAWLPPPKLRSTCKTGLEPVSKLLCSTSKSLKKRKEKSDPKKEKAKKEAFFRRKLRRVQ